MTKLSDILIQVDQAMIDDMQTKEGILEFAIAAKLNDKIGVEVVEAIAFFHKQDTEKPNGNIRLPGAVIEWEGTTPIEFMMTVPTEWTERSE